MSRKGVFNRRIPGLARREGGRGGGGRISPVLLRNARYLYGLSNLSAANYYITQQGGGEAGNAAAYAIVKLVRLDAMPITTHSFGGRTNATNSGWRFLLLSTGQLQARMYRGDGTLVTLNGPTFAPSDVGRIHMVVMRYTGSALELRAWRGAIVSSVAMAGYTPALASTEHYLGRDVGTGAAAPVSVLAESTLHGAPSDALLNALFDYARANGDLPASFDGLTIPHRWSARDALRGVANPAGRTTTGVRRYTSASYFYTNTNPGGIAGVNTGFYVMLRVRVAVPTGIQIPLARGAIGVAGWRVGFTGNALVGVCSNGVATDVVTSTFTVTNTSRILHVVLVHTGAANTVQLWVDGAQVGADAPCVGFTPYSARMSVGTLASAYPCVGVDVFDISGGHFVPTAAEILQSARESERVGVLQAIPGKSDRYWRVANTATIVDTIAGETLTRIGTLEDAVYVETAPPAPLTIADTVTGASVDAMVRVGSPQVSVIDTSTDGRVTYGILGADASSSYDGSSTFAPADAVGYWIAVVARPDVAPAGTQALLGTMDGAAKGYALQFVPQLRFGHYVSGSFVAATTYPVPTADLGRQHLYVGQFTGAALRLLVNNMQSGADVAASPVNDTSGMFRLARNGASINQQPLTAASLFDFAYGTGVPTSDELTELYTTWQRTGRLTAIPGKTTRIVRFTDDVIANGGPDNGAPTIALDRVGSDYLTRIGPLDVITQGAATGLRNFDAASFLYTASPGGIGTSGSTMWASWHGSFETLGVLRALLWGKTSSSGWDLEIAASNVVNFYCYSSAPALVGSATYTVVNGDLLQPMVFTMVNTGTALRLYLNGTQLGSDVVITGFTPNIGAMWLGMNNTLTAPSTGVRHFGVAGGVTAPSGAEVLAHATATLAAGAMQDIAGKTTRRYVLAQDITGNGGKTPARATERVSGADHLYRQGAGLTVAQRTERVWSYETSPILYGAQSLSAANYWSTAGGFDGSPFGFMVELLFRIDAQTAGTRILVAKRGGGENPGWQIATTGNHSLIAFGCGYAVTAVSAPNAVISSGDVGKLVSYTGVWDPATGKARGYYKRLEASTGSTLAAYAASANPFYIGRRGDGFGADNVTIFGFRAGDFVPTLAEVQSAHDRLQTNERMLASDYPGRALSCLYRFDSGVTPAQLNDLIGTAHLAQSGSPTVVGHHARNWGW